MKNERSFFFFLKKREGKIAMAMIKKKVNKVKGMLQVKAAELSNTTRHGIEGTTNEILFPRRESPAIN